MPPGGEFPRKALRDTLANRHWWVVLILAVAITCFYYGFVDRRGPFAGLFFFEIKHDFIGGLYFVAIFYATVRLGLVGVVASWVLCFAAGLPRLVRYSVGIESQIYNVLFFILPLLIAVTILLEMRWRARHARLAEERERERRMHIDHVFRAQEEERHRIAQGLHDDVLQRLLAVAYMAENLCGTDGEATPDPGPRAAEIRAESLRLAEDLRRLSYDLRPSMLDSLGLVSAVGWLSKRLQQESGIRVRLLTSEHPARFDPEIETTAFRVVQEALNNARNHSCASEVVVSLNCSPERLLIEVSDNGIGFPARRVMQQAVMHGHLGLLGMRERAESLHGSLVVKSRPDGGTSIMAAIPLGADNAGAIRT